MPYTRQQLLAAVRQDHPQLGPIDDNRLFAAIAQDHPDLARGIEELQAPVKQLQPEPLPTKAWPMTLKEAGKRYMEGGIPNVLYGAATAEPNVQSELMEERLKHVPEAATGLPGMAKALGSAFWENLKGVYGFDKEALERGAEQSRQLVGGVAKGAAEQVRIPAQGAAALIAPEKVPAPSDEEFRQQAKAQGPLLGSAAIGAAAKPVMTGVPKFIRETPVRKGYTTLAPSLPPPAAGFVRVFRGEPTPTGQSKLPSWINPAETETAKAGGRWFTNLENARWYQNEAGSTGRLRYIDVPMEVWEAAKKAPEVSRYSLRADEGFIPAEYASKSTTINLQTLKPELPVSAVKVEMGKRIPKGGEPGTLFEVHDAAKQAAKALGGDASDELTKSLQSTFSRAFPDLIDAVQKNPYLRGPIDEPARAGAAAQWARSRVWREGYEPAFKAAGPVDLSGIADKLKARIPASYTKLEPKKARALARLYDRKFKGKLADSDELHTFVKEARNDIQTVLGKNPFDKQAMLGTPEGKIAESYYEVMRDHLYDHIQTKTKVDLRPIGDAYGALSELEEAFLGMAQPRSLLEEMFTSYTFPTPRAIAARVGERIGKHMLSDPKLLDRAFAQYAKEFADPKKGAVERAKVTQPFWVQRSLAQAPQQVPPRP